MERPNTVAGLNAKRRELEIYRKGLDAELRKVVCDLDHIDAAIALFDPANTPTAIKRYVVKHRAKKGSVQRFVLTALRDATEPVTSLQVTEAWISARGLKTDDQTRVVIRKRIGACLTKLRASGTIEAVPIAGEYKGWALTLVDRRQ